MSSFFLTFLSKMAPHFSFSTRPISFTLLKKKSLFLNSRVFLSFSSRILCKEYLSVLDSFWWWWVMMVKKLCCFEWIALSSLLLAAAVSSKHHGNPANDIVDIINKNRTAQRLPQLNNSPGLGCMALQYVEECKGNCTSNNTMTCRPPEDDFTEVFAPNCGVELPTFGTISGHIVGCQHKYLEPSEAFSRVLVQDKRTLSLLRNKTHTEVGVGLIGTHKEFFWCVLFTSSQRNSSFVLEDLGEGIKQKKGCFSGTSIPCSRGQKKTSVFLDNILTVCFLYIYLFQDWYLNLF